MDERKLRGENADIYWFVCLYQLNQPVDNTDLLMKIVAFRAEMKEKEEIKLEMQETEGDVFAFDERDSHP